MKNLGPQIDVAGKPENLWPQLARVQINSRTYDFIRQTL